MIEKEYNKQIKVKFKGDRSNTFNNPLEFPIQNNDLVIVDVDRGEDIGRAIINPCKKFVEECKNSAKILRKATKSDILKLNDNLIKEKEAVIFCTKKIKSLKLEMKLVDAEFRLDRKKLTFYFTAENRIDFRELVKILASEYKTRIEMRQVNPREESKFFDGIGSCGKRICCKKIFNSFTPVNTQLVKDQNLPMNPNKISGFCGKLKCCFLYEHEYYEDVLKNFPPYGTEVLHNKKKANLEKIDIFQKIITLHYFDDEYEDISFDEFKKKVKITNTFSQNKNKTVTE